MLNLIIVTKYGPTISMSHDGDMSSFVQAMRAAGAVIGSNGLYVAEDNICHIVPQAVPNSPEAVAQFSTAGETKQ